MKILGIAGSLRKDSYNKLLLRSAIEVLPAGVAMEIFDLKDIPLFNQDVQDQGFPDPVAAFHKRIKEADCLLIASPEYNYSFTGVLKNAIDWASRPSKSPPILRKPAAIVSASPSGFGGARGVLHLRQVLMALDMQVVALPELNVSNAKDAFDADGILKDEVLRERLSKLINKLVQLTTNLQP